MNVFMETIGFTLLYLGFGMVMLITLYRPVSRDGRAGDALGSGGWVGVVGGSSATIVAWIGVYSYSIYLWHLAVKRWGVPMIVRVAGVSSTGSLAVIVYFASAVLIGAAMAWLVETPGLAFRDRWFPSRSGPTARSVGIVDSVPVAGAYI
jgi:peptidoglycan/LPS O-acetylase OafA/YrhL